MAPRHGTGDTVSERAAAALLPSDQQLIAEIRALERIALGRSLKVAANGRFPHWSLERWLAVISFLIFVIGGIWFGGGEWRYVKDNIAIFGHRFDHLTADIAAVKSKIEAIERQDAERRDAAARRAGQEPERVPPSFGSYGSSVR